MNDRKKGPRRKRKNYTKEKHLMDINVFYHIEYKRLLKEANYWNGSGQYWLGQESERRANAIKIENLDEYKKITHSEKLFFKTKKFY